MSQPTAPQPGATHRNSGDGPTPSANGPHLGERSLRLGSMKEQFDVTTTEGWLNEFVLQLRLRDADGAAVGDALAEVESHCADSGQTPLDAFGPPREYAASLPIKPSVDIARTATQVFLVGTTAFLGTSLLLNGLFHWGRDAVLSVGDVVGLGGASVFGVLLLFTAKTVIGRGRFWGLFAWYLLAFALTFVPGLLWRTPLFAMPAGVAVVAGLACLLVMVVVGRSIGSDRVRDPRRPSSSR